MLTVGHSQDTGIDAIKVGYVVETGVLPMANSFHYVPRRSIFSPSIYLIFMSNLCLKSPSPAMKLLKDALLICGLAFADCAYVFDMNFSFTETLKFIIQGSRSKLKSCTSCLLLVFFVHWKIFSQN